MAPPWLAGALAAILLVIAGYCATRLAAGRRWRRSTDHGADVMHVVMGVAMAGMLVPRLNPLQARAWAVLFAAGAAWFAGQAIRARRRARSYASSRAALPHGQHGTHVLSCSAMVCMLLADPAASAQMGAGPGAGLLPVAALILAIAVSVSVVVSTDRLPALRPAPVPITPAHAGPLPAPGPGPSATGQDAGAGGAPTLAGLRPVLCPRLAACCQIMMGVAMAYMLISMLWRRAEPRLSPARDAMRAPDQGRACSRSAGTRSGCSCTCSPRPSGSAGRSRWRRWSQCCAV